jgi:MFS family permease
MSKLLDRVLSEDPLIRAMSYQSVLSAFGEGAFLTGSAVYFTQIVGLSAAKVGLGMTIAGIATFLASVPLGRAADAFGTRRTWIVGSLLEALLFAAWLAARDFAAYVAVTVALELAQTWMRAGRNAYRIDVFPRDARVRSMAYLRAARNVGYTLGALAGGLALAAHSNRLVEAVPILTALILLANTAWVTRLPRLEERAGHGEDESALEELVGGGALRNRGFLAACFFDGVLGTHQVLLNVVIPLWLVEETDAPRVLLAWLFGTNTVLAVLLQVAAARGVSDVRTSLRAERRGALCFVLSCAIILVTHDTTGWLTIALVWLGHVTVTGSELFQSAGQWGIQAELSDPRQRGEYQGVANLGYTLGTVWAPAAYTFLAMSWGAGGWILIAAIICAAAVLITPAARAAERYLERTREVATV